MEAGGPEFRDMNLVLFHWNRWETSKSFLFETSQIESPARKIKIAFNKNLERQHEQVIKIKPVDTL